VSRWLLHGDLWASTGVPDEVQLLAFAALHRVVGRSIVVQVEIPLNPLKHL
jgi:hypothetical protein